VPSTGEAFRALSPLHRNLARVRRELYETSSEMSSVSERHQELRRRFSRDPQPPSIQARRPELSRLPSQDNPSLSPAPLPPLRSSSTRGSATPPPNHHSGTAHHHVRRRGGNSRLDESRPALAGRQTSSFTIEELDRDLEDANTHHLRALLAVSHSHLQSWTPLRIRKIIPKTCEE
jgi:hypothetical protein